MPKCRLPSVQRRHLVEAFPVNAVVPGAVLEELDLLELFLPATAVTVSEALLNLVKQLNSCTFQKCVGLVQTRLIR